MIIGGTGLCTGWLIGDEGHLMTNNHCIGNASDAASVEFQFNYEFEDCNGSITSRTDVVATTSTLVKTNSLLDYTLVKLPVNPTSEYGFLSFRSDIPKVGERIYIPQHPGGRRKEISVKDDRSRSGFAAIVRNGDRITYQSDTERGSSGSPVLSFDDNLVVALHNTGGCASGNGGNRNDNIIADIGSLMPSGGVDNGGSGGGNPCGDCIDFDDYTLDSYSNGDNGQATISDGGSTLTIANNGWKSIDLGYTVTRNTIIEFDFSSSSQGEIHGIGFDTDAGASADRIFKVHGTQDWGITDFDNYSGGTKSYRIEVGDFYTGTFDRLFFACDDDANGGGVSVFSNVKVYESGAKASRALDAKEAIEATSDLGVYPNPVKDILYLRGLDADIFYQVLNSVGESVMSGTGDRLDAKVLKPGIYIIRTQDDRNIRFIKD